MSPFSQVRRRANIQLASHEAVFPANGGDYRLRHVHPVAIDTPCSGQTTISILTAMGLGKPTAANVFGTETGDSLLHTTADNSRQVEQAIVLT